MPNLAKILDKILVTRTFRALTQILYLYYALSLLAVSVAPAVNVALTSLFPSLACNNQK
jgi:hypothetical protein